MNDFLEAMQDGHTIILIGKFMVMFFMGYFFGALLGISYSKDKEKRK
jgi:hypothetical protein